MMSDREARATVWYRACQTAEQTGCCGHHDQRYTIEVVDYEHGVEFDRWQFTRCRLTWRECQAAQLDPLIRMFSLLNSSER